jgi:hypothetical protein
MRRLLPRWLLGRPRAGRDIVRATYRLNYTQDPDGQWQGYTDGADPARAWGVSEWAHRAGQGAYFDWAVANAILPTQAINPATNEPLEKLARIERSAADSEIGEVAGGLHEIQIAMDEANAGVNPLGFDSDAITFDLNQEFFQNNSGGDRRSHFEQVYERATMAGGNAVSVLQFVNQANNKLRLIANDTEALILDSLRQDLDYRNRLIEIFGRPYTGQIGFGKAYPEGYEGPDTLLYGYLDKTKIDQIVPPVSGANDAANTVTYQVLIDKATGSEVMNNTTMVNLFKNQSNTALTEAFQTLMNDSSLYRLGTEIKDLSLPYNTASKYAFQAPADWGQRTSYGRAQVALQEMLAAEIQLDSDIADYIGFLQDMEQKVHRLQAELENFKDKESVKDAITGVRAGFTTAFTAAKIIINVLGCD